MIMAMLNCLLDIVKLGHRKIGASQNNAYLKQFIWNSLSLAATVR